MTRVEKINIKIIQSHTFFLKKNCMEKNYKEQNARNKVIYHQFISE